MPMSTTPSTGDNGAPSSSKSGTEGSKPESATGGEGTDSCHETRAGNPAETLVAETSAEASASAGSSGSAGSASEEEDGTDLDDDR